MGLGGGELPDEFEHQQLAVDPLVGLVAESAAADLTGPVSIADLAARGRLIRFVPGTGIRRHVDEALARAGVHAPPFFEMAQVTDLVWFAAVGLGVTIMLRTLAESVDCAVVGLVVGLSFTVVGRTDPEAVRPVSVVYDTVRISAAGKEFRTLLTESTRKK